MYRLDWCKIEMRSTKCDCMRYEAYKYIRHNHIHTFQQYIVYFSPQKNNKHTAGHSHKHTLTCPYNVWTPRVSQRGASLLLFKFNLNTLLDCTRYHKRMLILVRKVKCIAFFSSLSLTLWPTAHHTTYDIRTPHERMVKWRIAHR